MDVAELTGKHIYKAFGKYVSLNIVSMLGFSAYVLADTYFIANGIGSDGLVALNLVLPVYSLMSAIALMLGTGCGTIFSICRGKGDLAKANLVFTKVCLLCLIIGGIFTAVGLFASRPLVHFLGGRGEIAEMSVEYLQIMLCFSIPYLFNQLMIYMVRNDDAPRLGMFAMVFSYIFNAVAIYVFVYPLDMGMFGAGLAPGITPLVGLLVTVFHVLRKKNNYVLVKAKGSIKQILEVLSIGLPAFITEFASGVVIFVFNLTIIGLVGDIGVAAYGIIANISLVCVGIYTGLGQGIQPLISVNYGAGNFDNIKKVLRLAIVLALIAGSILYVCCFIFATGIAGIFNNENDPQLLALTVRGMRLYFIALIIMGANIACISFFASVSKPLPSLLVSLTRGFLAVLPLVLVLPRFWGLDGVWLVIPCAELIAFVMAGIIVWRTFNQQKLLLQ